VSVKKLILLALIAAILSGAIVFFQIAFAKESPKTAYITFDDGPTLNTPHILETLNQYDAKATFFVLEERIIMYPDFIKEILKTGNKIGLHGVSHSEAIYSTPTSPLEEMKKTENSLKKLTGEGSKLVRVPFGSGYRLTRIQAKNLINNGYILWDWNVDPRDSVGKIVPEKVLSNLKRGIKDCREAPVILFHDRKSTANLLDAVLRYLTENGYKLEALDEVQIPINSLHMIGK